jgi:hypothetical protein
MGAYQYVTWGSGLVDFNNDGHRDLYVACGHLDDNIELRDDKTSYRARNLLLVNKGDGTFEDVSDLAGDGMLPRFSSRGAAFDDLDLDGDDDVVVLNSREQPTILRNDTPATHHWLQVRLCGVAASREGVGSHVVVQAGPLRQVAEVHSGRSYQSHYGTCLHFGLDHHSRVDRIDVRWIGGHVDVLQDLPADQRITIVQGSSSG